MKFDKQDSQILMTVYNRARKSAQADTKVNGKVLEIRRVDRAFGILQSNDYESGADYISSVKECDCPDNEFSDNICKHRIAHMMIERIVQEETLIVHQIRNWELLKLEASQNWEAS